MRSWNALLVLVVAVAVAPVYAQRAVDPASRRGNVYRNHAGQRRRERRHGQHPARREPDRWNSGPRHFARFQRHPEIGSAPAHGIAAAHS